MCIYKLCLLIGLIIAMPQLATAEPIEKYEDIPDIPLEVVPQPPTQPAPAPPCLTWKDFSKSIKIIIPRARYYRSYGLDGEHAIVFVELLNDTIFKNNRADKVEFIGLSPENIFVVFFIDGCVINGLAAKAGVLLYLINKAEKMILEKTPASEKGPYIIPSGPSMEV